MKFCAVALEMESAIIDAIEDYRQNPRDNSTARDARRAKEKRLTETLDDHVRQCPDCVSGKGT